MDIAELVAMVLQGRTRGLERITFDPNGMGGKPYIRGMRVTVGTIVRLVASGYSFQEILEAYPYLEEEDIRVAPAYAAWRAEEIELPLVSVKWRERRFTQMSADQDSVYPRSPAS